MRLIIPFLAPSDVMLGCEWRAAAPSRSQHLELNWGSTRSIPRTTLSPMAMGRRTRHAKQASMWVATQQLPLGAAHPFHTRLNQILDEHDFDRYAKVGASDSTQTKASPACRPAATSACC
jgi:hypothetical protein